MVGRHRPDPARWRLRAGVAHSNWHFVEGSGTGELMSLHGSGSYESIDAQTVNSSFIYTFGEG